jgi:cytochrome c oxidase subunit 2
MTNIPRALAPHRTPHTRRRRILWALAATAVLSLLVAGPASADFWTPESGGSPNADKIDTLYKLVLAVAAVVFFVVEGALFYALFKFKARKGATAEQIHGNTRLEIGWTIGAAVILVILAVFTFAALPGIRNPENSGPAGVQAATGETGGVLTAAVTKRRPPNGNSLNVCVDGRQYAWRYTYAQDCTKAPLDAAFAYEEMVVPVDTAVTLDITAQDVAHSWWIPALGGKFDAIPGYTNHTWFKIPETFAGGSFEEGKIFTGQCAELCGRGHANMTARVRAVSADQFEAWIASQKASIRSADEQAATQRRELERQLGTTQSNTQ